MEYLKLNYFYLLHNSQQLINHITFYSLKPLSINNLTKHKTDTQIVTSYTSKH